MIPEENEKAPLFELTEIIYLEKFNCNPEDVILFRYPYEDVYDIITLSQIFEQTKNYFKDNLVIGIPNDISLSTMNLEELKFIVKDINAQIAIMEKK